MQKANGAPWKMRKEGGRAKGIEEGGSRDRKEDRRDRTSMAEEGWRRDSRVEKEEGERARREGRRGEEGEGRMVRGGGRREEGRRRWRKEEREGEERCRGRREHPA